MHISKQFSWLTIAVTVLLLALGLNFQAASSQDSVEMRLLLSEATPERLAGTFEFDDMMLEFESVREEDALYLRIVTGEGLTLVAYEGDGEIIAVELLDGHLGLSVPMLDEGVDEAVAVELYADAAYEQDDEVLRELAAIPEYQLLPTLSFVLGRAAYFGNVFPSALPLHQFALGASNYLDAISEGDLGGVIDPEEYPGFVFIIKHPFQDEVIYDLGDWDVLDPCASGPICPATGCSDDDIAAWNRVCPGEECERLPDEENDCEGLCGKGCNNPWTWVCGDDCWNHGCAIHDRWCGDYGYISIPCILGAPVGLHCGS